ncbi:MAG: glycosyltransferase family 2 protein [Cyanobacteriota bacterium]
MVAPVALITPCRNRAEHVIRSLPSWLACPQVNKILIVDFNSTPALLPQLTGFDLERVRVIRIENEPLWRQGRAQNVALRYAKAHTILKLDADIEIVEIAPYLEAMERDPNLFYRGFSKLGSSSGSCLFRLRDGRRCGGWHDHMSGWGGDDVDYYQRLRRRGLRAAVFEPESFRETTQPMEGKNNEAPRIDTELLQNQPQLACQPLFSGIRNTLVSVLFKQNRKRGLRYRFKTEPHHLVRAELKPRSRQELALGRYGIELANILTIHHFRPDLHPREILANPAFAAIRQRYQLPRASRQALLETLPGRMEQLRGLAKQLGVATLEN